jgi:CubicO group peptidase (beta-lactamase class C family)
MRRRAFLLETIGLALVPACLRAQTPPRVPDAGRLVAELEHEIPRTMADTRVPGLSIAVVRDAKLFWRRGFGVRRMGSRERVDHDTVFDAGSVSKTVFAYAVMKLCERGVIDLDTPLTRYSPLRILDGDQRLDLITARHVLSHSSGLQNWRSEREPLAIHFTPGERYLYSGEGYSYLQSVVTQLTGHVDSTRCGTYEAGVKVCATDFDAYMRENVLSPFGMASSGYVWNEKYERHVAAPHDAQGRPLERNKPTAIDAARYGAAGQLHTTPTDYAKFLIEILDPKPTDRFRLKKSTIAEMIRPQIKGGDSPTSSRALGWEVVHTDKDDVIVHGGDNAGFHAFAAACLGRRTGYIFMTNGDGGVDLLKKLIVGDTALNRLLIG